MWSIGGETGRAADALLKAAEAREDTSPGHAIDYCLQVRGPIHCMPGAGYRDASVRRPIHCMMHIVWCVC